MGLTVVCADDVTPSCAHRLHALIYATAHVLDLPLITADDAIHAFEDRLPSKARRRAVWD